MSILFAKRLGTAGPSNDRLSMAVSSLTRALNGSGGIDPGITRSVLSTESISDIETSAVRSSIGSLTFAVEAISAAHGGDDSHRYTTAQRDAAVSAGILAGDQRASFGHITKRGISTEHYRYIVPTGVPDAYSDRHFSLEAYDERDNRTNTPYTITYNAESARQDELCETLFPTIAVTPDNLGLEITIDLMMVTKEIQRNISGAIDQYQKINILRAYADATILKNEMTRITPVVRPQSLAMFVDPALVPAYGKVLEGESINTAPLAVGKQFSLLGISQTDTLLATGVMDNTDSIDPSIVLEMVYVKVTRPAAGQVPAATDVLRFSVKNLPLTTFTPALQNNYKIMQCNFETSSALMNTTTRQADGSALDALALINSGNYIVRLNLNMSGSVNVEIATTVLYGNNVSVHTIMDSAGNLLDLTSGDALTIATLINSGSLFGYDLQAYRTNVNRRQRGQLIDNTRYTQAYAIPFRNPVTALAPVNANGQQDITDLKILITTTRMRTSNAGVGALIAAGVALQEFVDSRDASHEGPDILGIGRLLIRPTWVSASIDMLTAMNSLTSTQRPSDVQATLVNKIRDVVYRMYRDSEYPAAANAYHGGNAPKPTVILATDYVLAQYLTLQADIRTLGIEFDVRIVKTLDTRLAETIYIAFGDFSGDVNGAPNPLHFGMCGWKPEQTLTLPISRDGQISRELTVQPSFLHIVNCPILAKLVVTNLPEVLAKVAIDMHSV